MFVDGTASGVEEKRGAGDESLHFVHADVALALLFGIVERVGVEKRPDELAADVFEAEFEMGVLEDGVVSTVESGCADVEALLVGDFFGRNKMGGITGAGGGDGGVEGASEIVAESNARRRGLDQLAGGAFEHWGLCGHLDGYSTRRGGAEHLQGCRIRKRI